MEGSRVRVSKMAPQFSAQVAKKISVTVTERKKVKRI